ncbi:hypothetical protein NLG97_g6817 [Lecanicillium saksenae]|uniref:Uncharacterized protein n=1 Tax=Lecanicillium saksenae TaxID=468837 RepID=A0ACC1QR51_9HYPO|nr:hypothetical protein NLG97_g6817 [Lecanicillium saksenae]
MQPLQRIGLARLLGLLICTSGVVRAGPGYGCNDAPIPCKPPAAFPGPEMKCKRCFLSIETLMEQESKNREQEDQRRCQSMVLDTYDGGDPTYYDTSHDPYAKCFTPGFLLYDGALECFALNRSKDVKGTLVGAMEKCLGSMGNFYSCLCSWGIGNSQLANMTPCFYGTKTPNMLEKCPNLARQTKFQYLQPAPTKTGTKPKIPKGRGGKTGNRRSTVPDGSNTNSDDASTGSSNDGSNDGPDTNSNTGDGSNSDYFVDDWPPNVDDQFSPVLEDTDVSFYLDIWERIVLVDTETNEFQATRP